MHTVQARGILSADNTMNVYRGCTHGCIYCDSRSRCYRIRHDFEDVEVKENAAERLSVELAGRRERVMVHTGSMCDPYLPLEAQTRLSRRCAEVILQRGCEEVGVKHIFCFGMGLTLREGSREYYYAQLDRLFPGLRARYAKRYGLTYEIPSDNAGQLMRAFLDFGAGHGICTDIRENFAWCRRSAREGRQLSLFDFGSSDRA